MLPAQRAAGWGSEVPNFSLNEKARLRIALGLFLAATVWITYSAHQLERSLKEEGEPKQAALIGQPAPDFTLPRLEAASADPVTPAPGEISLTEQRGQVVILSFWASWCRPCDYELPLLNQFYLAHRNQGVTAIAISVDSEREAALRYARSHTFALPMAWDERGHIADRYKVDALPTLVVIDPEGRIRRYERGLRYDLDSWLQTQVRALAPRRAAAAGGS